MLLLSSAFCASGTLDKKRYSFVLKTPTSAPSRSLGFFNRILTSCEHLKIQVVAVPGLVS